MARAANCQKRVGPQWRWCSREEKRNPQDWIYVIFLPLLTSKTSKESKTAPGFWRLEAVTPLCISLLHKQNPSQDGECLDKRCWDIYWKLKIILSNIEFLKQFRPFGAILSSRSTVYILCMEKEKRLISIRRIQSSCYRLSRSWSRLQTRNSRNPLSDRIQRNGKKCRKMRNVEKNLWFCEGRIDTDWQWAANWHSLVLIGSQGAGKIFQILTNETFAFVKNMFFPQYCLWDGAR